VVLGLFVCAVGAGEGRVVGVGMGLVALWVGWWRARACEDGLGFGLWGGC